MNEERFILAWSTFDPKWAFKFTVYRPGYKKTKVGWIPQRWECSSIIPHIEGLKSGLSRLLSDDDIGLPMLRSTNIVNSRIDVGELKYWHKKDPQGADTSRYFLKDGDLLVNFINSMAQIGKCALFENKLNRDTIYTTNIFRLRFKNSLDHEFFFLITGTQRYTNFIQSISKPAVNQASFTTVDFRRLNIPLPPLPEQEAIAGVLECWDKGIRKLELKIGKKRNIKKGLMQKLLSGQQRLPGFGKGLTAKEHKERKVPEGWKTVRFGKVTAPKKTRFDSRQSGIHEFCIELEHIEQATGKLLGNTIADESSSLKTVFTSGEILFGKLRSYLRKYWHADRSGVCSTEIWVFAPDVTQITNVYLFQLIKTDPFIDATCMTSGTHMPRSDWNAVKNYKLSLPSLKEQQAIAEVLSAADREIEALERKLDNWRDQKKYLLNNLVTGTIRLPQFRE